jgi:hypothetical protein
VTSGKPNRQRSQDDHRKTGREITVSDQHFKFIINEYIQQTRGGLLNVTQIKAARDEAAGQILEIVRKLEHDTGMRAMNISVEYDTSPQCTSTGITGVEISLELP